MTERRDDSLIEDARDRAQAREAAAEHDRSPDTAEDDVDNSDRAGGWAGVPDAAGIHGGARDDLDSTLRPVDDED